MVLPFVPVTPTTSSTRRDGRRTRRTPGPSPRGPTARSTCATSSASSQRSTTSAARPGVDRVGRRSRVRRRREPGTQKNRTPGPTCSVRCTTPVIVGAGIASDLAGREPRRRGREAAAWGNSRKPTGPSLPSSPAPPFEPVHRTGSACGGRGRRCPAGCRGAGSRSARPAGTAARRPRRRRSVAGSSRIAAITTFGIRRGQEAR